MVSIKSGNYSILSSGTVIQYDNEPIVFEVSNLTYTIKFFKDESGDKKSLVNYSDNTGHAMTINLHNFDNNYGVGTTHPLDIGTYENQRILLSLRVYTLGGLNQGRTIHYTFYLGGGSKNA